MLVRAVLGENIPLTSAPDCACATLENMNK